MALYLDVDQTRWEGHLDAVAASTPGLVPVVKGNGYGFGVARLAAQAARMGCDTLAVGTDDELGAVRDVFGGDVLVLTPWRPLPVPEQGRHSAGTGEPVNGHGGRVLRTVSHLDVLAQLASGRAGGIDGFVVEMESAVHRHGVSWTDLDLLSDLLSDLLTGAGGGLAFEGIALHLPLTGDGSGEVARALSRLRVAGVPVPSLWLSHAAPDQVRDLRERAGVAVRARVGTALWLGRQDTFAVHAEVLDVHRVTRGQACGYRGRRVVRPGFLVVASGGTGHGIGLQAPAIGHRGLGRLRAAALAALAAGGLAPSPFRLHGRRLAFADTPHMQVSMLFLPEGAAPPRIGDQLTVTVRMTITTVDGVRILRVPATRSGAPADGRDRVAPA